MLYLYGPTAKAPKLDSFAVIQCVPRIHRYELERVTFVWSYESRQYAKKSLAGRYWDDGWRPDIILCWRSTRAIASQFVLHIDWVFSVRTFSNSRPIWCLASRVSGSVCSKIEAINLQSKTGNLPQWKLTWIQNNTEAHKVNIYNQVVILSPSANAPIPCISNPSSVNLAPSSDDGLRFLINELGDFTSAIDQITLGIWAYVNSLYGHLTAYGWTRSAIVTIASGIRIRPYLASFGNWNTPESHDSLFWAMEIPQTINRPNSVLIGCSRSGKCNERQASNYGDSSVFIHFTNQVVISLRWQTMHKAKFST